MGDWKLILNGNDGVTPSVDLETGERKQGGVTLKEGKRSEIKIELFNLREDPGETKNLAAAQSEIVKQLRARYDVYFKSAVRPLQLQKRGPSDQ
jgi:hypothetical protein